MNPETIKLIEEHITFLEEIIKDNKTFTQHRLQLATTHGMLTLLVAMFKDAK